MVKLALWLFSLTILSYTYTILADDFIDKSCRATMYPAECIKIMTPEAGAAGQSPLKLAQIALSINIKKTEELLTFATEEAAKPGSDPKVEGLKELVTENLELLIKSSKELETTGADPDFRGKMAHVNLWLGEVLTYYSDHVDGYNEISKADAIFPDPLQSKVAEAVHGTHIAVSLAAILIEQPPTS